MESANIPHHLDLHQEQQQQLLGPASSSSSSHEASYVHGSWYGASSNSSNHFAWSAKSPHMNVDNKIYQSNNTQLYKQYTGEKDENDEIQIPWSNNNSHNNTCTSIKNDGQHQTLILTHEQPSNSSKLDLFNSLLFPKFTDMLSSTQSSIEDLQHLSPTCYVKNDHFQDLNQHDTKSVTKPALLMSPSGLIQPQFQVGQFLANTQNCSGYGGSPLMPSRGTFSQIFPSVNISNMSSNQSCSTISGSLDMNLQALDLLTSARFGGAVNNDNQSQPHHLGLANESHAFGQQHMQQFGHRPTASTPNKLPSPFLGGSITEAKRSQPAESKSSQASSKKSRSETRACPPLKVRKEKLGDRIAALQQLVAPFGKTDTASVLMEAIGYIKFLQNQIETLSVPYMKSSRSRPMKQAHLMVDHDDSVESKRDLRSRGLCLVPLSCMSYVTNEDGSGWPSTEYLGGT
uniref:BHLH domain-containing protein n=1 Tax=Kalanchoe fedtschenkoi TaxID=63787 RepID=A0A7N0TXY5_KALFE